jgi:hypothetical protein
MKSKQQKREEGEIRNAAWRKLSTAEKLALLDATLGPGQGATRQREKFAREVK